MQQKRQINQTTVYTYVHFTVDVIMCMYVNNLTVRDSRYTNYNVRKCEVRCMDCN